MNRYGIRCVQEQHLASFHHLIRLLYQPQRVFQLMVSPVRGYISIVTMLEALESHTCKFQLPQRGMLSIWR